MEGTREFLDALSRRWGGATDYAIAKRLGVSKQSISNYRSGIRCISDELAIRIAAELELDPAYVLACVNAERQPEPAVSRVWLELARRLAAVVLALGAIGTPGDGRAGSHNANSGAQQATGYTLRAKRRRQRPEPGRRGAAAVVSLLPPLLPPADAVQRDLGGPPAI